jgi:TIR domain
LGFGHLTAGWGRVPTIFLSHSSRNDGLASSLEAWLRREGFDDLFLDHASIRSGDKWRDALRQAKGSCRIVLCLVTAEWLASDECYGEFTAGWYAGRRIMPLLALAGGVLDEKQKLRLERILGEDQAADLGVAGAPSGLDLDAHPEVGEPIKAGLRAAGALVRLGLDPFAFEIDRVARPEPFPGLESFRDTDADAAIFFGRSAEIAQCLEDLREMRATGDRRAYAIQGASGSGKSSLMKAGVLPRLRRERAWLALRSFRPGSDPLLGLAGAIAETAADLGESRSAGAIRSALLNAWRAANTDWQAAVSALPAELANDAKAARLDVIERARLLRLRAALDTATAILRARADRLNATILIAMDQGEELARAEGESADALADFLRSMLADLSEGGAPVLWMVCFTVRSDSFQELQAAERFRGIPTRPADIRSLPIFRFCHAIEQPASRYGVELEPKLVDALIEDASGSDALPLLAFTLQRLWRQFSAEGRIRLENYAVVGKLHGLIEDAAERALRGLDPSAARGPLEDDMPLGGAHDKAAAGVFVPCLARLNERGAAIRRVAQYQDFDDAGRRLLAHFDRWRLVVRSGATVEVAHEALFRVWPRFKSWLAPEKARLEALRGLESAAAAWGSKGQAAHELIHRGRRLAEARALDQFVDYRRQLDRNPEARAYLAACRAAAGRRRLMAGAALLTAVFVSAGAYWLEFARPLARSIALADQLHHDFGDALQGAKGRQERVDFSTAETDVRALFAINANSGHALYYAGEIARIANPSLFDLKSCVRAPLQGGNLDVYETSFFRYLDTMRALPERETGGDDLEATACGDRAGGFCRQRTAWIYHLLANDLYAEAQAASDPRDQAVKAHSANSYAEEAMRLYSKPGQSRGFTQCTASEALARKALELELAAERKATPISP